MKLFRPILALFPILLLLLALVPATAANSKPAKAAPPPDLRKLIKSVDVSASTVVIEIMRDKSLHTYKIDDLTVVQLYNSPAKITDIKPGMEVSDYLERYSDTLDKLSLTGSGTDTTTPKAKTPAKPKPKPVPSTTTPAPTT